MPKIDFIPHWCRMLISDWYNFNFKCIKRLKRMFDLSVFVCITCKNLTPIILYPGSTILCIFNSIRFNPLCITSIPSSLCSNLFYFLYWWKSNHIPWWTSTCSNICTSNSRTVTPWSYPTLGKYCIWIWRISITTTKCTWIWCYIFTSSNCCPNILNINTRIFDIYFIS